MNTRVFSRRKLLQTVALGTVAGASLTGSSAAEGADDNPGKTSETLQPSGHVISHLGNNEGIMAGFPPPTDKLVTVDNWDSTQSHARWTHLHLRDLVPTHVIRRGTNPVRVMPVQTADIDKISVPDGNAGRTTVAQWLRGTGTDAFLVLHRGSIIHEEYFHGMRQDEPHLLWSATKSVAFGVIANFIDQGKLQLDAEVVDYISELRGTGYEGATIRHCLDMQSGVDWDNESDGEKNTWSRYSRANGFLARKQPGEPLDQGEWHALMTFEDFSKSRARPHGEFFYYKDSDYRVLTWACEKVAGRRFADLVSDHVWRQLGCEYDADILCDGLGSVSDGMCVTLRDLARWGQLHLNGGRVDETQVIPKSLVDDILSGNHNTVFTHESVFGPRHGLRDSMSYRNLFWVDRNRDGDAFYSSGYLGQFCYVIPRYNSVIVKLSTWHKAESISEMLPTIYRDVDAFRAIATELG